MGRLILYRDQAYSEKEWEARQRQLAQQREYDAYVREWMRRRRAA
jgi:hypothetical protein